MVLVLVLVRRTPTIDTDGGDIELHLSVSMGECVLLARSVALSRDGCSDGDAVTRASRRAHAHCVLKTPLVLLANSNRRLLRCFYGYKNAGRGQREDITGRRGEEELAVEAVKQARFCQLIHFR